MKVYGSGTLDAPGTRRVIWDFADGVFDTVNPAVLDAARKMGCVFGDAAIEKYNADHARPEPERRKPGRPPKGEAPEKKKAEK